MNRILKLAVLAIMLPLVALAQGSAATSPPLKFKARIIAYGLFDILGDETDKASASTAAGRVSEHSNSKHIATTNDVPARLGQTFGFRYVILGLPDGEHEGFEMRAHHPAMTGPSGRPSVVSTADTYAFSEGGVAANELFYTLAKDFEVLPGDWRLEILYRGQVVLTQSFKLVLTP